MLIDSPQLLNNQMKKKIKIGRHIRCMLDYDCKIDMVPIRMNQLEQCRLYLLKSAHEEKTVSQVLQPTLSFKVTKEVNEQKVNEQKVEPVDEESVDANRVVSTYDDFPDIINLNIVEAVEIPSDDFPDFIDLSSKEEEH